MVVYKCHPTSTPLGMRIRTGRFPEVTSRLIFLSEYSSDPELLSGDGINTSLPTSFKLSTFINLSCYSHFEGQNPIPTGLPENRSLGFCFPAQPGFGRRNAGRVRRQTSLRRGLF